MNSEKFNRKRNALQRLNPIDLSEKWLRLSRIGVVLFAVVIVRVTMSTLPMFDIDSVHDNLLNVFQGFQTYLRPSVLLFLAQLLLIVSVVLSVGVSAAHFIFVANSLKYPLAWLVFFTVKFLSDVSLHLKRPTNILWDDLPGLSRDFIVTNFFHANVDFASGAIALGFAHFFNQQPSAGRKAGLLFYFVSFLLVNFVQLTLQTVHSYSIFSALIIAGFSVMMSMGLLDYWKTLKSHGGRPWRRSSITSINSDLFLRRFRA